MNQPRVDTRVEAVHLTAKIPDDWQVNIEETEENLKRRLEPDGLAPLGHLYINQCWLYITVHPLREARWGKELDRGGVGVRCAVESCIVLEPSEGGNE